MNIQRSMLRLGILLVFAALVSSPATSLASGLVGKSTQAAPANRIDQQLVPSEMPIGQIILKYRPLAIGAPMRPASAAEIQRLSDAADIQLTYVREMSGDAYVLGLPSSMALEDVQAIAERLSALPEVEYAEPDAIMTPMLTPNDPQYGNQWHYFAPYGINVPAAWDITTGSSSITLAVIDTGITNHADLSGRTVPGYDFITDVPTANDGGGRDSDPSDPGDWIAPNECYAGSPGQNSSWHGTHTAGTIGAASNNGLGVTGVDWNSKILPVRVLGKCGGSASDIVDAVRWSAGLAVPGVPSNSHAARVLNISIGGTGTCGASFQSAINDVVAAGSTVVVSAGNSNANAGGFQPANCNGVITVAATNRNGSRAFYSNYGAAVEISAPGGETTISSNGVLSTLNTGTQGPVADTYVYYQGTSMAAPHVAGVASLMLSRNPTLTPAQILSIMQSTVTGFPGGSSCNTSLCGSGIVNAGAAVAAVPTIVIKKTYLPVLLKNTSTVPAAPVLNPISNSDGDGNYNVTWNAVSGATSYLLQEDDTGSFASPASAYSGASTSYSVTGKGLGTWYYRVRASNAVSNSPWSNVVLTVVAPPTGPTPGFWDDGSSGWMEFYVSEDGQYVEDFAIYISVTGCGNIKITHTSPAVPISGNSFSFAGPFYFSGAFSSATAASGTAGLRSFYIPGCGYVSGGPDPWAAVWRSAQAAPADASEGDVVTPTDSAAKSKMKIPASGVSRVK